jgi:nucleotide-binding universal stress UspA family protein
MSMASIKKILCAVDFSERSYNALEQAVVLARQSDAELHLVHVVSKPRNLEDYQQDACSLVDHIEARMILDSYVKLSAIVEERVPKAVKAKLTIRQGDAATEIIRSAQKESADMIVLGTEERKGWRRFLSGSVAHRVIRQAVCPVVTIQAAQH